MVLPSSVPATTNLTLQDFDFIHKTLDLAVFVLVFTHVVDFRVVSHIAAAISELQRAETLFVELRIRVKCC